MTCDRDDPVKLTGSKLSEIDCPTLSHPGRQDRKGLLKGLLRLTMKL